MCNHCQSNLFYHVNVKGRGRFFVQRFEIGINFVVGSWSKYRLQKAGKGFQFVRVVGQAEMAETEVRGEKIEKCNSSTK